MPGRLGKDEFIHQAGVVQVALLMLLMSVVGFLVTAISYAWSSDMHWISAFIMTIVVCNSIAAIFW